MLARSSCIDKLRDIYHQQGIEVTDEVLRAGVKALAESRFAYTPPKPASAPRSPASMSAASSWGPATLAIVLVLVVGLGGYFLAWQPFQAAQAEAARIELSEAPARADGCALPDHLRGNQGAAGGDRRRCPAHPRQGARQPKATAPGPNRRSPT